MLALQFSVFNVITFVRTVIYPTTGPKGPEYQIAQEISNGRTQANQLCITPPEGPKVCYPVETPVVNTHGTYNNYYYIVLGW